VSNERREKMKLSAKAIRFIIEAIEYRIGWYEHELKREDLSEDEKSDLTNDLYYFRSILRELKAQRSPTEGGTSS
jgi:hypothetical protein